jgi:RNA polymerase sigma factor (sigma-70 family)
MIDHLIEVTTDSAQPCVIDEAWFLRLRQNDTAAWGAFYACVATDLTDLAETMLRKRNLSPSEAGDIVTETFFTLMDKIGSYTFYTDSLFKHLMISIAHNHVRTLAHSEKRKITVTDLRGEEDEEKAPDDFWDMFNLQNGGIEDDIILREQMRALNAGIATLTEHEQEVFMLRVLGKKPREIAELLGIKPHSVSQSLYRAYKKLREFLLGLGDLFGSEDTDHDSAS